MIFLQLAIFYGHWLAITHARGDFDLGRVSSRAGGEAATALAVVLPGLTRQLQAAVISDLLVLAHEAPLDVAQARIFEKHRLRKRLPPICPNTRSAPLVEAIVGPWRQWPEWDAQSPRAYLTRHMFSVAPFAKLSKRAGRAGRILHERFVLRILARRAHPAVRAWRQRLIGALQQRMTQLSGSRLVAIVSVRKPSYPRVRDALAAMGANVHDAFKSRRDLRSAFRAGLLTSRSQLQTVCDRLAGQTRVVQRQLREVAFRIRAQAGRVPALSTLPAMQRLRRTMAAAAANGRHVGRWLREVAHKLPRVGPGFRLPSRLEIRSALDGAGHSVHLTARTLGSALRRRTNTAGLKLSSAHFTQGIASARNSLETLTERTVQWRQALRQLCTAQLQRLRQLPLPHIHFSAAPVWHSLRWRAALALYSVKLPGRLCGLACIPEWACSRPEVPPSKYSLQYWRGSENVTFGLHVVMSILVGVAVVALYDWLRSARSVTIPLGNDIVLRRPVATQPACMRRHSDSSVRTRRLHGSDYRATGDILA